MGCGNCRSRAACPSLGPDCGRPARTNGGSSLWQSLAFWRGLTLAASVLAAACLAALIYLGALTQPQPLVATIEGDGHRHFVATIDTKRGTVAVVPAAFTADATRVPELWLIPADGKPRPVGLLRADRTVTLALPAELAALAKGDAVLAVSLEPPGGSTDRPAHGPGDSNRQAHVSVNAASLRAAPP